MGCCLFAGGDFNAYAIGLAFDIIGKEPKYHQHNLEFNK